MYKHLYINMFHCTYLELVVILGIYFINLASYEPHKQYRIPHRIVPTFP